MTAEALVDLGGLDSSYEVLHRLGGGGMGSIYKVRHVLLNEARVIKVMKPELLDNEDARRRFLQEARNASKLRHPNIAQLYDFTIDQATGTRYIVMEFVDGLSFEDVIRDFREATLGLVTELACQALHALELVHRRGFVHRDISPDNLMVARDFESEGRPLVKLIDLGIAKEVGSEGVTKGTSFMGKVKYAAPECLSKGSKIADARADLYAFGVVLYQLLTGEFPIHGDDPASLVAGHVITPIKSFEETDPEHRVPSSIRRIVVQALAKDPKKRLESAAAFRKAIESARPSLSKADESAFGELLARRPKTLTRPPEGGTTTGEIRSLLRPETPPDQTSLSGIIDSGLEALLGEDLELARQFLARGIELDSTDLGVRRLNEEIDRRAADERAEARRLAEKLAQEEAEAEERARQQAEAERQAREKQEKEDARFATLVADANERFEERDLEGCVSVLEQALALRSSDPSEASTLLERAQEAQRHDREVAEEAERISQLLGRGSASAARQALEAASSRLGDEPTWEPLRSAIDELTVVLDTTDQALQKALAEAGEFRFDAAREALATAMSIENLPEGAEERLIARAVEIDQLEDDWRKSQEAAERIGTLIEGGQLAQARETLDSATEEFGAAPFRQVRSHLLSAEAEERRTSCERHLELGRQAMESGDFDEAVACFEDAVQTDPTHQAATTALGVAGEKLAEEEAERARLQKVERAVERVEALRARGHLRLARWSALLSSRRLNADEELGELETVLRHEIEQAEPLLPSRARRQLLALGVVGLVLVATLPPAVNWFFSRSAAISAVPSAPGPDRTALPIESGSLFVDAEPWGRVTAVRDDGGVDESSGLRQRYTPLFLGDLAPGRYEVDLEGPEGQRQTLTVEIEAGKNGAVRHVFEEIDEAEFFETFQEPMP